MKRVSDQTRKHRPQRCALVLFSLLFGACTNSDAGPAVASTVANPTMAGTTCEEREVTAAETGPDCQATFSECTDDLDYELKCEQNKCACFVDGVQKGSFVAEVPRCDVDIALMKIACGWVAPGVKR